MTTGARTPEELDTLFEDAFLLRDRASFAALFLDAALLVDAGGVEARGGEAIGRALGELWDRECSYVAGPRRVLRSRDTALVIGDVAIHVLHRDDGEWRAAISLLDIGRTTPSEDA